MKTLKANLELQSDGTLQPRHLKMQGEELRNSDPVWVHRIKTWERLKKFGSFKEVAERSGVPVEDRDFAARYGDRQWYQDDENSRCKNLDRAAIQIAIDELSGRAARRNKLKTIRRKAGGAGSKAIGLNERSQRYLRNFRRLILSCSQLRF